MRIGSCFLLEIYLLVVVIPFIMKYMVLYMEDPPLNYTVGQVVVSVAMPSNNMT
jgi:hypothetical protein